MESVARTATQDTRRRHENGLRSRPIREDPLQSIPKSTRPLRSERFAPGFLVALAFAVGGCAMFDTAVPVDEQQAASLEREADAMALEREAPSVEELQRWSRLSKEGREHLLLGRTAEAEESLLEAFAVTRQFRASDVRRRVSFGNLERLADRYLADDAEAAARRVLSIIAIESAGMTEFDYPRLSDRLVQLGSLEELRGDLEAAVRAYRRALDLRTDKSGANSPSLIEVLLRLSTVEVQRDQAARGSELAERAVTIAEMQVGENSKQRVDALLHAATANQFAGRLDVAEAQYDAALAAQRAIESSSLTEAAILNGLAFVHLETSQLGEAQSYVDNALSILDLLGIAGLDRAVILDTKAQIYAARDMNVAADSLFDEVMLHADSAAPATQRALYESYEDFLVDQNRLGEAKRVRERIDALVSPAARNEDELEAELDTELSSGDSAADLDHSE